MTRALPATLAALALACVSAADASAQCALCRSGLEKAGEATAQAINLGILVLLVPPVAIFCTIFAAAYRKSKGGDDDKS
ncbi:MAG TPA: hypothetical protein VK422_23245 [Pyrinomonadaceae bacterium]|nr:hypothetical protein [Pyrinomonadaceae bacterium]